MTATVLTFPSKDSSASSDAQPDGARTDIPIGELAAAHMRYLDSYRLPLGREANSHPVRH